MLELSGVYVGASTDINEAHSGRPSNSKVRRRGRRAELLGTKPTGVSGGRPELADQPRETHDDAFHVLSPASDSRHPGRHRSLPNGLRALPNWTLSVRRRMDLWTRGMGASFRRRKALTRYRSTGTPILAQRPTQVPFWGPTLLPCCSRATSWVMPSSGLWFRGVWCGQQWPPRARRRMVAARP